MNKKNFRRERTENWYHFYVILSWFFGLMFILDAFKVCVLNRKESVTLFDLFVLTLFLIGLFYFRLNALHYHSLLFRMTIKRRKSKQVSK